jgi:hypothetical protein
VTLSAELPEFVLHWARALGSNDISIIALKGGMNNNVFSCAVADKRFVIKGYLPLEPGHRDRFAAESQFLSYSNAVASAYVPEVLHVDDHRRCIVMEYLDGDAYTEGSPPKQQDIDAAIQFFSLLNQDPVQAAAQITMDAAEGFLTISAHLQNVRERIKQMSADHLPLAVQPKAKKAIRLLRGSFRPAEERILNAIRAGQIEDAMPASKRCVSPSDFGFHNAIRTAKGVKFFDFEFGGWDDPAKAAVDFMLQPRVPVQEGGPLLLRAIFRMEQETVLRRAEILKPILKFKWVCIIGGFLRERRFKQLLTILPNTELERLASEKLDRIIRATEEDLAHGLH